MHELKPPLARQHTPRRRTLPYLLSSVLSVPPEGVSRGGVALQTTPAASAAPLPFVAVSLPAARPGAMRSDSRTQLTNAQIRGGSAAAER